MAKVSVKKVDNLTPKLQRINKEVSRLLPEAHKEFVRLTPVDTGNARRKTSLKGTTIHANYPYADRLDDGYSKQAPRGMIEPFERWLRAKLDKIIGK